MQSLRDVRMNPVPQADYSLLEKQLERIESALGSLPQQMSEAFRMETSGEDWKVREMKVDIQKTLLFRNRIRSSFLQSVPLFAT